MESPQAQIAKKIATRAHAGQFDKAGRPYIEHPEHVAKDVCGDKAKALAWLHDVVEDTDTTFAELAATGIDDEVIEALRLLTHDESVPYFEYVNAIKSNALARTVKLSDLRHNSDLSRLKEITDWDLQRRDKYLQAIKILES